MKVFEKYIFKEHAKIFTLVLLSLVSIYFLVIFLDILDDVLEKKAPIIYAIEASLLKIPFGIKEIGATAILISVIVFLSISSKNLEPVILNSLGIPVKNLIKPLIIQACIFSVFLLINNNYIAPYSFYISKNIVESQIFKRKKKNRVKPTKMWVKYKNYICYIGVFNDKKILAKDVRCVETKENEIKKLIKARMIVWKDGKWVGYNVSQWDITKEKPKKISYKTRPIKFFIEPNDLKERKKQKEEMNSSELRDLINDLKKENMPANRYLSEYYNRIFLSLSPIIMVIFGFPLGVSKGKRSGAIIGIIKGLVIAFSFWCVYYTFSYMGKEGWIPPLIASAIPLIIFTLIGKKLMERTDS